MTIEARKLLLNSSEESTNVELSHPDMTSLSQTSKSGPAISYLQDNSDISSSPPLKASSLMKIVEKDILEERSSASSIDDLL